MKYRSFLFLFAFCVLILAVGLACAALSPTPTAEPTSIPTPQQPQATASDNSGTTTSTTTGSDLVTFTDKNNYYQIDLPNGWNHTSKIETNDYWDRFTSPDGHAVVDNLAYDDGTVWTGSQNGQAALLLLNNSYSYTKKEGDIRVTDDSIQKDGSERLTWTSKGGGYSGISYFEVRNRTTFLMFTVFWDNDYQNTYVDVLDKVVSSYRVP